MDKNSSNNKGTLLQAKHFLNAVNAPNDPMKDPDAAFDLLSDYTDSLVLSCYDGVEARVGRSSGLAVEQEKICDTILDTIVDEFAIPKMPEIPEDAEGYTCLHCKKRYKKVKTLRKHILEKHSSETKDHQQEISNDRDEDGIFNYSCNALALGLLAKDFYAARKEGDGKRIIRLYKFFLLFFRLESRTKYSYYSLYTLAQAYHLLPPFLAHELVWNRTNNTSGKSNGNVENDRTCEHHVKSFKSNCKEFQGKVTSSSIKRASCSYTGMKKLMKKHDTMVHLQSVSGKHVRKNSKEDVKDLAKQFSNHQIFCKEGGRYHEAFPGFKRNILEQLDIAQMADWVKEKICNFEELSIFKRIRNLRT